MNVPNNLAPLLSRGITHSMDIVHKKFFISPFFKLCKLLLNYLWQPSTLQKKCEF